MSAQLSAGSTKVWLLYAKHLRESGGLSLNVIREIGSYFADFSRFLPQITKTFLRFFDCYFSTWGPQVPLSASIQADVTSSWVVLEDGRLFCSGGGDC